ncbi:zinc ribbon domain-containing protein [Methanobrevibacter filiformis]|uniref:Zinc-ribbon domain-containing protein n=1 Tax=Methanobrevibacter filiformis TaxID=55758 RepID=A0A162FAG8_9EURY|nr:zinc ribbon domain-containing protein [Methanobrevibacter filiformis]KZX10235.1 hypothetical protein MBFIL_18520 [Methanobrevibacter filiformis]
MVFCSYCGTENANGSLKCYNCGKALPLIHDDNIKNYSSNNEFKVENSPNIPNNSISNIPNNGINSIPNNNNTDNYNTESIKEKYVSSDSKSFATDSNSNKTSYLDPPNNNNNNNNYSNESSTLYNREYHRNPNVLNKRNNVSFSESKYNSKYDLEEVTKEHSIEWDVIVATALIFIILTAILNRIFSVIGIFISLFIALIYILVATKNKNSLFKSIPIAIIMIAAISAYLSL